MYQTIPPDQLTETSTTQKLALGTTRVAEDGSNKRYVYFKAVAKVLQGDCIYQYTLAANSMYEGSKDQSLDCPLVAGVAMATVAAGSYGWAQVRGYYAYIRSMNDIALKDALVGGTTDGEADGDITNGLEEDVFGFALSAATTFEDDNGDTLDCCAGMLTNCLWG